jgi:hypothetical protein
MDYLLIFVLGVIVGALIMTRGNAAAYEKGRRDEFSATMRRIRRSPKVPARDLPSRRMIPPSDR